MHTRLFRTSILVLTLAAVVSAACTRKSGNPGTTGTGGRRPRVPHRRRPSLNADKTINDNTNSFKPNDTIYASVATGQRRHGDAEGPLDVSGWTGRERIHADDRADRRRQNGIPHLEAGWMAGRKYKVGLSLNGSRRHEGLRSRTLRRRCTPGSVAQHDAQERVVDLQAAVVVDEPELPKLVHEEVDTRARRADHLGQEFLRHSRKRAVRRLGFTVAREQQQRACQPLLAGVEELVDQIFFDADVPRQHVRQETIRERGLGVELPHHFLLLDGQDRARGHRRRGGHPLRLAREAALAEEMARTRARRPRPLFPRATSTDSRTAPFSTYMTLVAGSP